MQTNEKKTKAFIEIELKSMGSESIMEEEVFAVSISLEYYIHRE